MSGTDNDGVGRTLLALGAALVALAGSLWLSLGMELKACPLCLYQRTFVMGVVAVLTVGLVAGVRPGSALSLLALPLAVGGVAVAGYHVYLEGVGKLECPRGVFEVGSAPQQGLAAQAVVLLLLAFDAARNRGGAMVVARLAGVVVLGALLAGACVASAPPPVPTCKRTVL